MMLENAVYSVITVEGCAAILWKDGKSPEMREKAATALRITAPDLFELRVIDEIIPEPRGRRATRTTRRPRAGGAATTLVQAARGLRRAQAATSSCGGAGRSSCEWDSSGVGRRWDARSIAHRTLHRAPRTDAHLIEVAFKGNRKEFFLWEADEAPPLKARR